MNSDRVAAAAVAAIAVALFAATFGFEQMPEGITRGFGAEVFPRLVLGTVFALAVLLAVFPGSGEPLPRIAPMVYYSGASFLAFMALVPVAGMLPAMFLFLVGLGRSWGERRLALLTAVSAGLTAAIWAIFAKGFGIPLPKGMLY